MPRLLFAFLLLCVTNSLAAPPPWEAKKLNSRESFRSFTGVLAAGDALDKFVGKPCKVFPLKMSKGGLYTIGLKSGAFAPLLRVLAGDMEVAGERNADAGKNEIGFTFLAPRDHEYDLVVSTADGKFGGFTLTVQPKGKPGDKGVTLHEGDASTEPTFPLKAAKSKLYALDLFTLEGSLRLELMDPKGKVVASSQMHEGDTRRAHVDLTPEEDAAYQVRVAVAAGKPGKFLLRIAEVKNPLAPLVLEKGETSFEDELNKTDKPDTKRKTRCKIYPIALKAEMKYTIDLESSAFDAFLRLEDPDGKEVAWDDDSGSGNNSRINYVPKVDGQYRIIATTFGPGGQGAFTLRVREAKKAK